MPNSANKESVIEWKSDTKDADKGLKKIGDKVSDLTKLIKSPVGLTAATAGLATGLGVLTNQTAQYGRELDNQANQANLNIKTFQQYDHVFKQNGLSTEQLIGMTDALAGRLYEANEAGSAGNLVFKELGVVTHDNNGQLRDQEKILAETIKALQNTENQTRKVALADELWGGAGTQVLSILNLTNKEMADQMKLAEKYGIKMDENMVAKSKETAAAVGLMNQSLDYSRIQITSHFLPALTNVSNFVSEKVIPATDAISGFMGEVGEFYGNLPEPVKRGLTGVVSTGAILGLKASVAQIVGFLTANTAATRANTAALTANTASKAKGGVGGVAIIPGGGKGKAISAAAGTAAKAGRFLAPRLAARGAAAAAGAAVPFAGWAVTAAMMGWTAWDIYNMMTGDDEELPEPYEGGQFPEYDDYISRYLRNRPTSAAGGTGEFQLPDLEDIRRRAKDPKEKITKGERELLRQWQEGEILNLNRNQILEQIDSNLEVDQNYAREMVLVMQGVLDRTSDLQKVWDKEKAEWEKTQKLLAEGFQKMLIGIQTGQAAPMKFTSSGLPGGYHAFPGGSGTGTPYEAHSDYLHKQYASGKISAGQLFSGLNAARTAFGAGGGVPGTGYIKGTGKSALEAFEADLYRGVKPDEKMAAGGIVTRPTVALIGEAGPEAVVPLRNSGMGTVIVNNNIYGNVMNTEETESLTAQTLHRISERGRDTGYARNADLEFNISTDTGV